MGARAVAHFMSISDALYKAWNPFTEATPIHHGQFLQPGPEAHDRMGVDTIQDMV